MDYRSMECQPDAVICSGMRPLRGGFYGFYSIKEDPDEELLQRDGWHYEPKDTVYSWEHLEVITCDQKPRAHP